MEALSWAWSALHLFPNSSAVWCQPNSFAWGWTKATGGKDYHPQPHGPGPLPAMLIAGGAWNSNSSNNQAADRLLKRAAVVSRVLSKIKHPRIELSPGLRDRYRLPMVSACGSASQEACWWLNQNQRKEQSVKWCTDMNTKKRVSNYNWEGRGKLNF